MTNKIPLKANYTGNNVTSLGEFNSGDTISGEFLDLSTTSSVNGTTIPSSSTLLISTDVGNTVVGTTSTQTLTNKTLDSSVFTNGYTEESVVANTGSTYTIDLANGTVQILTLTASCTFTFPTATAGKSFMLLLKQDGSGSKTVTWAGSVRWPSNTAPSITSTANKGDKFVFTADGTYWWGSVSGQGYL
jgi:hypothetical protein